MEGKKYRGRYVPYAPAERRCFAELIREHGARGARELLARQVSLHTLLKIAGEFQIPLKKGRRPALAAAEASKASNRRLKAA